MIRLKVNALASQPVVHHPAVHPPLPGLLGWRPVAGVGSVAVARRRGRCFLHLPGVQSGRTIVQRGLPGWPTSDRAVAVSDLDVLRPHEARQADQEISLSGTGSAASGQGLHDMRVIFIRILAG
jgi:hypothetical protein